MPPQDRPALAPLLTAILAAALPAVGTAAPIDTTNRQAVIAHYHNEYVPGNAAVVGYAAGGGCNPGTTSGAFQNAVLDRVNYFRSMAGVPAVALNSTYTRQAQAAAHLISVNNRTSHNPTSSWQCFSQDALTGAQRSNLFLHRDGMAAIDGYLRDDGPFNTDVAHRRWMLNPPALAIGVGDVTAASGRNAASALYVVDRASNAPHPATRDGAVAWPPEGYVPHTVVYPRWHFSQLGVDFTNATVAITRGGQAIPSPVVARGTENLLGFISWSFNNLADGATFLRPIADERYTVTIRGAAYAGSPRTFTYDVTIIDPAVIAGDANFDGVVDGADYSLLRDGQGTRYTRFDLDAWRANYGRRATAGSAAVAIPEPAGGVTIALAAAWSLAKRRVRVEGALRRRC